MNNAIKGKLKPKAEFLEKIPSDHKRKVNKLERDKKKAEKACETSQKNKTKSEDEIKLCKVA